MRDRIVGRVALEDQRDYENNLIVGVNQEITENLAEQIQASGIERVKIQLGANLRIEARCLRRFATDATWRQGVWSGTRVKLSVLLQRSRSANLERSSPCVRSTSVVRRREFPKQSKQDAKSDGLREIHQRPVRA